MLICGAFGVRWTKNKETAEKNEQTQKVDSLSFGFPLEYAHIYSGVVAVISWFGLARTRENRYFKLLFSTGFCVLDLATGSRLRVFGLRLNKLLLPFWWRFCWVCASFSTGKAWEFSCQSLGKRLKIEFDKDPLEILIGTFEDSVFLLREQMK